MKINHRIVNNYSRQFLRMNIKIPDSNGLYIRCVQLFIIALRGKGLDYRQRLLRLLDEGEVVHEVIIIPIF